MQQWWGNCVYLHVLYIHLHGHCSTSESWATCTNLFPWASARYTWSPCQGQHRARSYWSIQYNIKWIHIFHYLLRRGLEDVENVNNLQHTNEFHSVCGYSLSGVGVTYILMMEPREYLDLTKCALTICLMFKWTDFLDSYFKTSLSVKCTTVSKQLVKEAWREETVSECLPHHTVGTLPNVAQTRITWSHVKRLTPHYLRCRSSTQASSHCNPRLTTYSIQLDQA